MIYRRYSVPSMWEEMDRMQREMGRMMAFSPARARSAVAFPAVNAWTTDDEEVITAELPGVEAGNLELNIVNDVLTISGERKTDLVEDEEHYHRRERSAGKFSRSIQLAFPVDSDRVNAAYENGLLTINLPRAEADKPRKITVKSS